MYVQCCHNSIVFVFICLCCVSLLLSIMLCVLQHMRSSLLINKALNIYILIKKDDYCITFVTCHGTNLLAFFMAVLYAKNSQAYITLKTIGVTMHDVCAGACCTVLKAL